jgi:hypothetical protein
MSSIALSRSVAPTARGQLQGSTTSSSNVSAALRAGAGGGGGGGVRRQLAKTVASAMIARAMIA